MRSQKKSENAEELYQRLSDPSFPKDDEEIRLIYKKLLLSGERLTAILGAIEDSSLLNVRNQEDGKKDEASNVAESFPAGPASFKATSSGSSPVVSESVSFYHSHIPLDDLHEMRGSPGKDKQIDLPPKSGGTQTAQALTTAKAQAAAPAPVRNEPIGMNSDEVDTADFPDAISSGREAQPNGRRLRVRLASLTAIIAVAAALCGAVGVSFYARTHRASEQYAASIAAERPPTAAEAVLKVHEATAVRETDGPSVKESAAVPLPATSASSAAIPRPDAGQPPAAAAPDGLKETAGVPSPTTLPSPAAEPELKAAAATSAPVTDSSPAATLPKPPASSADASGRALVKDTVAVSSPTAPPTPAAEQPPKADAAAFPPETNSPSANETASVPLPATPVSSETIPARDTGRPPAAAASDRPPVKGGVAVLSPTTPPPSAAEPPLKADAPLSTPEAESPSANETASVSLPGTPASSAAIADRDTDQPPTPVASASPPVKETAATPPTASSPPSAPRHSGTASDGSSAQPLVTEKRISSADAMALLARGDALIATGDVAAARLFYERGANGGNAEAALRLGETYDSSFLAQVGLTGVRGDMPKAISWYQRADDLGSTEASEALKSTTGR